MRSITYEKLSVYSGYIGTKKLLNDGLTNRQIAQFTEEGLLEKICHGHYWVKKANCEKPIEYKAIEVCLSDPKAVICADSACFYLGLIHTEPGIVSVATSRNDRSAIKMKFPVKRHYFSQSNFFALCYKVSSEFGNYNVFDVEKSVCDCIRFREGIDEYIFELIIDNYRKQEDQQKSRLQEYAKRMCMLHEVEKYF